VLYKRSGDELYNRIFVVSAFSGVTDWLLENKKTDEPGIYHRIAKHKEFHHSLHDITEKLQEINKKYESIGLDLAVADEFVENRIIEAQRFLENLANILASGYVSDEAILLAAREILASIGETHSAFNVVNVLQNNGINATLVDLSGFHDHKEYTIDQRIRHSLKNIDHFNKKLIVELKDEFQRVTVESVAMVCLIGSNIDQPGVLGKAACSLAQQGINIKSGGFSLGKVNIQFVVAREDFKNAVIALNNTMFF